MLIRLSPLKVVHVDDEDGNRVRKGLKTKGNLLLNTTHVVSVEATEIGSFVIVSRGRDQLRSGYDVAEEWQDIASLLQFGEPPELQALRDIARALYKAQMKE
jgi:hypothetical protein